MNGEGVRAAVRDELATGTVTGPRDLAERLDARGLDVSADELRAELRSAGAIRVEGAEGPVLAIPVNRDVARGSVPAPVGRLRAVVAADADWPVQVAVVAVIAVFLLVAVVGWLISP